MKMLPLHVACTLLQYKQADMDPILYTMLSGAYCPEELIQASRGNPSVLLSLQYTRGNTAGKIMICSNGHGCLSLLQAGSMETMFGHFRTPGFPLRFSLHPETGQLVVTGRTVGDWHSCPCTSILPPA